jgi:hypothetical protein
VTDPEGFILYVTWDWHKAINCALEIFNATDRRASTA